MEGAKAACFATLFLATQLLQVLSTATAPAFLWSPHHHGSSQFALKEVVNYRTLSPKELAKSVLSDGSWSNLVCTGENNEESVDIALVFIGRKLLSSDISRSREDPALIDLLKSSFTSSNFSMAFPYVAVSDEQETLDKSIISGFTENCGSGRRMKHIAFLESCSVDGEDIKKRGGLHSVHDYINSRMETKAEGQTDLIVFCNGGVEDVDHTQSDGEILSELVSFLEQTGATYTVLYASDPHRSIKYPSLRGLDRFLAEDPSGNGSANFTLCDGVCQIKSSLLEGIFVGVVLLIILLSGLCCMMGIDTPTRFETPQDS